MNAVSTPSPSRLPISAVIATRDRATAFSKTLESLLSQESLPQEFLVVDASDDDATKAIVGKFAERTGPSAMVPCENSYGKRNAE